MYSCASLVSCYIGTKIRNDSPKITIVLSLNINIQNNIVFLRLASERTTPTMIIILLCFFTSVFADNSCFRVNLQFNEKCISKCPHHFNAVKANETWLDTTPLDLVYPVMTGAECQALCKVTYSSDQFILTSSTNYEQILRLFRCCKYYIVAQKSKQSA